MGDEWRKGYDGKYEDSVYGREAAFQQDRDHLCPTCQYYKVGYIGSECDRCKRDRDDDMYGRPKRGRRDMEAEIETLKRQVADCRRAMEDAQYQRDDARRESSKAEDKAGAAGVALQRAQGKIAELQSDLESSEATVQRYVGIVEEKETAIRALVLAVVALEKKLGRQIPGENELRNNLQNTDVKDEKVEKGTIQAQTLPVLGTTTSKLDLEWESEHKYRLAREANFLTLFKWLIVAVTWLSTLVTMV